MKKLLLILAVISFVLLFASCEHEHTFGEWEQTAEPTCTVEGARVRRCECGETETEKIPVVMHTATEATCKEESVCEVCGEVLGAKLEHTATEATCTKESVCEICGEVLGPKLEHTVVKATCTEWAYCSVCEEKLGDAPEHVWDDPTCTEGMICLGCGAVQGEPAGHQWLEPTCSLPERCARCGIEGEGAPAHKWKEATCENPQVCSMCYIKGEDALGHDIPEATCTAPQRCKRCQEYMNPALPHKWVEIEDGIICELCETKLDDYPVKLFMSGDPDTSQAQAVPESNQSATITVDESGKITVLARASKVNMQWVVDESVNVNIEDAPVILIVTKGYCTCGQEGVCYSLESCDINLMVGNNTEASESNRVRDLSMNYDPIGEGYRGFFEDMTDYPFAKGRINSINIVFNGISYWDKNEFEICFIGFFENADAAMEYARYYTTYVHEAQ